MQEVHLPALETRRPHRPDVPEWLVGLWRRESIRFTDGTIDRTTRVFWGQTRSLCVDIRAPLARPEAMGRRSLLT